jgi:UDP-2-acetamido-2,6-beta-L-arabino-hexul-4-ose reductase
VKILITGSKGFVGRNLVAVMNRCEGLILIEYDLENDAALLDEGLRVADVIFHLAGVNRPQTEEEFHTGNTGSTEAICRRLTELGRSPKMVLSSSIQAELNNPYGISKRHAEEALRRFSEASGAACVVYRLKNLFGKWCRPNYNSVTATFCYNIAHDLPIQISDPDREIELTYIDDVVAAFIGELKKEESGFRFAAPLDTHTIRLGDLAQTIQSFKAVRTRLFLPDFSQPFIRALYATYLSYLDGPNFAYDLTIRSDERGSLAELIKSHVFGQIFVSYTKPGITRGDHYHHTKTEKFLVVHGEAIIRFRHILGDEVIEYHVNGADYRVVDIPPGYTHSIQNVGNDELVTIFWADEVFEPERPDTYFEKV